MKGESQQQQSYKIKKQSKNKYSQSINLSQPNQISSLSQLNFSQNMRQNSLLSPSSPNRSISPIHYVKPSSVQYSNTISPQRNQVLNIKKSVVSTVSPYQAQNSSQVAQQEEVDLWKSRCNDLETSLCQVNTDLELASFKAKKAKELEGKVDDILKQNSQLLGENDALSKQFSIKRREADIWKSKYEAQVNNIFSIKANSEAEIKRLEGDLKYQRELYDNLQQERLKDSQESKQQLINDNLTQIESIKRSHVSNLSLYEEQIRKLRDDLEQREKDLQQVQGKLSESRNYCESESNRLNDDKERLRAKIAQMELDQSKELENQKRRGESLTLEQINSLKKLHESELDVLESELNKLKNLLEIKNNEIQLLIQQNKSQKRNFENELQAVRDENGALKDKILENNRLKEEEIEELQNKLAKLHTTDISDLKGRHENQIKQLNNENKDLLKIIESKSDEIANQIKEKVLQRESYNAEVDRLRSEIETQKLKQNILERDRQKDYEENQEALSNANAAHAQFSDQQKRQILFLEEEIEKLKQLLVHKNNEIDTNIAQQRAIKTNFEEDIRELKRDNSDLKKKGEIIENQKNAQIEELKNKNLSLQTLIHDRTRQFEAQIDYIENELKRTRENLQVKVEEASNHQVHRNLLESETKKLNTEIEGLQKSIVHLENTKAQEIQILRQKLENSNTYTIDSIKNSHNNLVNSLQAEIEDLKSVVDMKDSQLSEKADQYQKLEKSFAVIRDNSDLSDYQQRFQNLDADLATTKNIYEVFIKTRQSLSSSGKKLMPNNSGVSPNKLARQFDQ